MTNVSQEHSGSRHRSKARVLFYLPEGNVFTNGVYASQCLGLARYLVKSGMAECAILQFATRGEAHFDDGAFKRKLRRLTGIVKDSFSKQSFIEKRMLENGIVLYEDTKTRRNISIFRKPGFFAKIARRALPFVKDFKPTHIYCRSYQTAFGASWLAKKLNAKMVYSIRGEDVSEKRCAGGIYNYLVSFWVRRSVVRAIRLADRINTVSRVFRDWLKNEYGCEASVTPCCVDERMFIVDDNRIEVRQELGFSETDKVLVYCGGLWPWRCSDEMVSMMKHMCEECANIRVLFIVRNEKSVNNLCIKAGFQPGFWRIHGCSPNEVGKYMHAGDAGILLHRGKILDRVCSPIKIGEYLASGLGIIVPAGTGDLSKDASGKSFYCEYEGCEQINRYVNFISGVTKDIRADAKLFAQNNYTWAANEPEIRKMFS